MAPSTSRKVKNPRFNKKSKFDKKSRPKVEIEYEIESEPRERVRS